MKKVLAVDLSSGRLTQTDGLDGTDQSLYGSTGKSPIGDGTGKLDASWLLGSSVNLQGVWGLPDPQYDSGWVTLVAGQELILAHNLGAQPAMFLITYKDDYSASTEKVLPISGGVGVWRQRVSAAYFLLYTNWSYIGWNDAGQGITSAPIRVRAWRSGITNGPGGAATITISEADGSPSIRGVTEIQVPAGSLTDLGGGKVLLSVQTGGITVKEADGAPSVANITEIQVPAGSLTDLGGGKVLLTLLGGSGGSLANPMTACGDLIVGGAATLVNMALLSSGAAASSAAPVYQGNVAAYAIDGSEGTAFLASTSGNVVLNVDLGVAQQITAYRVLQYSSGHLRSFAIDASVDNITWSNVVASLPTPGVDTGVLALLNAVAARYWRITLNGPSANPAYGSGLSSFELHVGLLDGYPSRLPIGPNGQVLTVVNNRPAWAASSGGGGDGSLYLHDTFY